MYVIHFVKNWGHISCHFKWKVVFEKTLSFKVSGGGNFATCAAPFYPQNLFQWFSQSCVSVTRPNSNPFEYYTFLNKRSLSYTASGMYLNLPNTLTYCVDGAQFLQPSGGLGFCYSFNSMLTDVRNQLLFGVTSEEWTAPTLTHIYPSSVWLERELCDFSGVNFSNASDTRRLLLDYFEVRQLPQTHISNDKNYNDILYEVVMA